MRRVGGRVPTRAEPACRRPPAAELPDPSNVLRVEQAGDEYTVAPQKIGLPT